VYEALCNFKPDKSKPCNKLLQVFLGSSVETLIMKHARFLHVKNILQIPENKITTNSQVDLHCINVNKHIVFYTTNITVAGKFT
jgi:hypothetical protein